MKLRTTLICLVLLLVLPSLVLAETDEVEKVKKDKLPKVPWQNYYEAMATGKGESKPILLHFTTSWNQGSKKMIRETYGDMKVTRYLQENFATGWIETGKYKTLAEKYQVSSLPTLWFLDSTGKTLTSVAGTLGPEKMMLVMEFINTKAYESSTYEAWKEKRLGK